MQRSSCSTGMSEAYPADSGAIAILAAATGVTGEVSDNPDDHGHSSSAILKKRPARVAVLGTRFGLKRFAR
jgi:hypothetical protein